MNTTQNNKTRYADGSETSRRARCRPSPIETVQRHRAKFFQLPLKAILNMRPMEKKQRQNCCEPG